MCTALGTFYIFDIRFSVPEYLVKSKKCPYNELFAT